jgi:hypothetical protein
MKIYLFVATLLCSSVAIARQDYICTEEFRKLADYIVEDGKCPVKPSEIPEKSIVYAGDIHFFFARVFPYLRHRIVLITHDSDGSAPFGHEAELDSDMLIAWFAENVGIQHPKLKPIPIGMAHLTYPGNTSERKALLEHFAAAAPNKKRIFPIYLNISADSHWERATVLKLFSNHPWVYHVDQKRSYIGYLQEMSRFAFVFSPRGAGLDCLRTWEALYLRCIPIVRSSTLDPIYEDLPVLIVDEWSNLTADMIRAKYSRVTPKSFDDERLYMGYWADLIRSYAK